MFARTRRFFKRRATRTVEGAGKVFNVKEVRQNWGFIRQMAAQLTRKPETIREETFRHAYKRLNLSEAQLAQTHKYYLTRFYIFSTFASLALGAFIFSLLRLNWYSLGPSLGALMLMVAYSFQASFRLYQIERREMVDVGSWFEARSSWIPAPFQAQADRSSDQRPRRS